jgi:hypothetical protein
VRKVVKPGELVQESGRELITGEKGSYFKKRWGFYAVICAEKDNH